MKNEHEPSYQELKRRLGYAESALKAIREGQVDTVLGDNKTLVVQLAEAKEREDQINQELIESEKKYRDIFVSAPIGIFKSDPEGTYKEANPKLAKIMGYDDPEELIEVTHSSDIANPLDVDPGDRKKRVQSVLEGEGWLDYKKQFRRKDGKIITCAVKLRSAKDQDGSRIIEGFVDDITDRELAEEEQREKEKLQGIIELAGTVCHELSQPMQIISGSSDLLLMNSSEENKTAPNLRRIQKQIERMSILTNKISKITRYAAKHFIGEKKIIDLENATERRRMKRFMPIQTTTITSTTNSLLTGKLIEIGTGGFSFWSHPNELTKNELMHVTIHVPDADARLETMPCMILSKHEPVDDATIHPKNLKRYRVKFGHMVDEQAKKVEDFIWNHTTAKLQ